MANSNAPFGLAPVEYLSGAPWNGQVRRYCIPSTDGTAYAIGDPVVLAGSADAKGIATVIALPRSDRGPITPGQLRGVRRRCLSVLLARPLWAPVK